MKPENNLDYLAARHAQALITTTSNPKEMETSLTKTLGVLQEHGVYACFLYLYAREKAGARIASHMLDLLRALAFKDVPQETTAAQVLLFAQSLTSQLPTLLLAREALERFLIYARYGAKAAQKE
jgi:hypothetical protein